MFKSRWGAAAVAVTMFAAGFGARSFVGGEVAHAQGTTRVFEMRTYTAAPGKFADLQKRFRDHTLRIFEKHGMQNVGYWVPADPPNSENTLVYILAHKSREAAKKSWASDALSIKTLVMPEWWILVPLPICFLLLAIEFVFRMRRLKHGEIGPRDDAVSAA